VPKGVFGQDKNRSNYHRIRILFWLSM